MNLPPRTHAPSSLALAVFCALASFGGPAAAQATGAQAGSTEPTGTLQTVTVSASGLDAASTDMAAPVTVLSDEELVQRRAPTLGETLDGLPGIRASQFGNAASRPVIRGMDAARVRVLSDGAEVMDASTVSPDHAVALEPVLTRRIEVIRGPSALAYGSGAIGGVVNVLDDRVPTRMPRNGLEGDGELRADTAAGEGTGAAGVTVGSGRFALRAEGLVRRAGDYTVGRGWEGGSKVPNSFNHGETGTLGASWIGDRGYIGLAYTRQQSRYGLPGNAHAHASCEAVGDSLQCTDHPEDEHTAEGAGPYVDLRSDRWDLRGEYREPFAGFTRARLRAGTTDYAHDEIEGGVVGTRFRNRASQARLELAHHPLAGWGGTMGVEASQRDFSATGEEAYLVPTRTRRQALYLVEARRSGPWRFEAGLRQEWQRVDTFGAQTDASHSGTSASVGAQWQFAPSYALGMTLSRSQRLPTAEELYANGLHLATKTIERGNPDLGEETARNVDLTLRKTAGKTRFSVSAFRNRIGGYIYANTLDAVDDLRLVEYAQRDATFRGVEAQVSHRLTSTLGVTVFGDAVRASFAGGGDLPRIPAGRYGVRLDAFVHGWETTFEWYRVLRQDRVADFETTTAGYAMVNVGVGRNVRVGGTDARVYLNASNLGDVLAFNHASYIKTAAPLMGRRITAGIRVHF